MEILSGKDLDLDTLVSVAEELAKNFSDGHLTVMRFTTGWKCVLGTPCFDSLRGDREIVWHLPSFATPQDALIMPTASTELRRQWGIDNEPAERHLRKRGFRLNSQWFWEHDTLKNWEDLSELDRSAIRFLADEWDFGGFVEEKRSTREDTP